MKDKEFVFVGNREFILQEMIKKELNIVKVIVMAGSYLEKNISNYYLSFCIVNSKDELIFELSNLNFDILISNGCYYKIPVSSFNNKTFINIHPSYLPDLKGKDPIIASILFKRDSGATCHLMNDLLDGGDIISQVKVLYSDDLDAALLYQISFIAEKEVFNLAYNANFRAYKKQLDCPSDISYSFSFKDQLIDFRNSSNHIIQQVKSLNNRNKGCFFFINNFKFKFYRAEIIINEYLVKWSLKFNNLQVLLKYENSIIFRKDNTLIKFSEIDNIELINNYDKLEIISSTLVDRKDK